MKAGQGLWDRRYSSTMRFVHTAFGSEPVQLCKRCGVAPRDRDLRHVMCRPCYRQYMYEANRRYLQTEKGRKKLRELRRRYRETARRHRQTEKYREKERESRHRYRQTEKYRETARRYRQAEKYREKEQERKRRQIRYGGHDIEYYFGTAVNAEQAQAIKQKIRERMRELKQRQSARTQAEGVSLGTVATQAEV